MQEASEQELHAFRWHELQLRLNTGAPCSRAISSRWWNDYHELDGPNWALPGGFQVSMCVSLVQVVDLALEGQVPCVQAGEDGELVLLA